MAINGDRPEQTDLVPRFSMNSGGEELPLVPEDGPEVAPVPLHERWYFWAGAGAVVAAGAAAAYVLINGRGLSPSEVCQGRPCPAINYPPAIVGF